MNMAGQVYLAKPKLQSGGNYPQLQRSAWKLDSSELPQADWIAGDWDSAIANANAHPTRWAKGVIEAAINDVISSCLTHSYAFEVSKDPPRSSTS